MVKLSWQVGAWALAFYSTYLLATADPTMPHVIRDGLFVAVVAWLISFRQGSQLALTRTRALAEQLTTGGHIVLWTGIVCTLVGSLLGGQTVVASPPVALSGTVLWWIGLLLLTLALFLPKAWTNRRHPAFVTDPASNPPTLSVLANRPTPGVNWLSLLLLILIGSGIRWLVMRQQPTFCLGAACEAALAINEGTAPATLPFVMAQWLNQWLEQGLLSLRWSATLLASLAIACFYLLTRRLVNAGSALLGTLLLVTTPWLYTLDGGAFPALTLFFWSTVALWLLLTAWQRQQPRWALLAGVALGFATQLPLLQVGLLLWLLLLTIATILSPRGDTTRLLTALLALFGFVCSALPVFWQQGGMAALERATLARFPFAGTEWLVALFQPGLLPITQWTGVPGLTLLLGSAIIVGMGYLLRNSREPLAGWIAGGWMIALLLFIYTGNSEEVGPSTAWLIFLSALVATVAFHALLTTFNESWRQLVPPANAVAIAALLLLLFSWNPLRNLLDQSGQSRSAGQSRMEQAIITAIDELLATTPDFALFAPASLLENPATRLQLGDAVLKQIQPLSAALDVFYTSDTPRDTAYFVPASAQPYSDLIQRIQPGIMHEQRFDPQTGEALYTQLTVNAADQIAQQGLLGMAWERSNDGSTSQLLPPLGPLVLEPGAIPALRPPYSLQWTGALRVAAPGTYRFTLDLPPSDTAPAQGSNLSLQLDNRLILDSVLGVTAQELMLAKGFYQLTLFLHNPGVDAGVDADVNVEEGTSNDLIPPTPFAIRWQRPDGREEIVPRNVLYRLPLQNVGLIGEYYVESSLQSTPFDLRKDLVVGLPGSLAQTRQEPYRIQWRGQLAAPRTGEYLLAALAAPASITRLALNGAQLFDTEVDSAASPADPSSGFGGTTALSSYAEGTIYLERGWHEITVDYQPDAVSPPMQLFWQPPGSAPMPLAETYLAPSLVPLTIADRDLPQAPPLSVEADTGAVTADGNNVSTFVLSYGTEYWRPQAQLPPAALPALPFEAQWQVGSCGSSEGQLAQPHGVALSAVRERIYVADTANQRVVEYTLTGTVSRIYTYAEWQEPVDVVLIDEGFPVVLDAAQSSLTNLNPVTGSVEPRPVNSGFYYPRGLAVDPAGNLIVADTGGGRVVRLLPGGDPYQSLGGPETKLGRGQPTDVVEAGGTLWAVTAEDGRLWQPANGGSLTAIQRTNTINGPHLAGLPTGALFLSDPVRRSVLYFAATGEPQAMVNLPGLLEPTGIAVAPINELLYLAVVDTAGCQLSLWRTDPAGLLLP